MKSFMFNQRPKKLLQLDQDYIPMILANIAFEKAVKESIDFVQVKIAIERSKGQIATQIAYIFSEKENQFDANYRYIERLVKTLLWLKGGWKVIYGGPKKLGIKLQSAYQIGGDREFDFTFMGNIYEKEFTFNVVELNEVPKTNEQSKPLGRHLDGYRIGFDAGGSDRKVSAVVNGEAIYSEEVVWHPKLQTNPQYIKDGVFDSVKRAASKMPRVDAIGVSSAGIFIDNRVAAASLFLKVPKELFDKEGRNMYLDIASKMGDIPIEVCNDGDVTALAGAMSLGENKVLGIAMGTSEAAGYVDELGNITGWLNELCFVPVDYNPNSIIDEWSLDAGCGVKYFSQDSVIKLAKKAKIEIDDNLSPAEKLKVVQKLLVENNALAKMIFETIGVYLGYTVAYYARFYDISNILVLGRVTSGEAGNIMIRVANNILKDEFNDLYQKINLILPDEKSRRVGQSIAAASLPKI